MVTNKESCTIDELKSAVEWLGNRNNANRAELALLNGQAGEDIIKQAKDIIEEGRAETKVQERIAARLENTKAALDRLHDLIKPAESPEAQLEVIRKEAFLKDVDYVSECVKMCNTIRREAIPGMQGVVGDK